MTDDVKFPLKQEMLDLALKLISKEEMDLTVDMMDVKVFNMKEIMQGIITKQFGFWQSKVDMATSPMNLMLDGTQGYGRLNVFKLARSNKGLNVAMDSITKFENIEGSLL